MSIQNTYPLISNVIPHPFTPAAELPETQDKSCCSEKKPASSSQDPNRPPTPISISLLIGALIGITEATVNHPLWVIKTLVQQNQRIIWRPSVLYRGFGVHIVSSVPLDICQVAVSRVFYERVFCQDWDITQRRIVSGFIGGAFSSLISAPSEMVMTWQQTGDSGEVATRKIIASGGVKRVFAGLIPAAARDGIFCCGVFAGVPLISRELEGRGVSSSVSDLAAGILSGFLAAIFSQPPDVIKTHMQSSTKPIRLGDSVLSIYKESGIIGFGSGFGLRVGRVISAVMILGNMNKKLEKIFNIQ